MAQARGCTTRGGGHLPRLVLKGAALRGSADMKHRCRPHVLLLGTHLFLIRYPQVALYVALAPEADLWPMGEARLSEQGCMTSLESWQGDPETFLLRLSRRPALHRLCTGCECIWCLSTNGVCLRGACTALSAWGAPGRSHHRVSSAHGYCRCGTSVSKCVNMTQRRSGSEAHAPHPTDPDAAS